MIGYFALGYLSINHFNQIRGTYHFIGLPNEEKIPFLIPFILGYNLVYASIILLYLLVPQWEQFKKVAWGFFWITTIHYIFFLVFPVKMIWRPEIVNPQNFFGLLTQFFFSLDNPYNCFPSLHVAYPTLAAVFAWKYAPRWRYLFASFAILTAISVVLIKQHYILDAVGGMLVSTLVGVLILRK
ncbi:MAG: phosphatase PAP2 family protein [Phaeospirillum sp.]|nr:phosphatase PAP2 family protein [Phaeospirillum sp.]